MRVNALIFLVLAAPRAFSAPDADLGRRLFFDKRLSADQKVSCASCHKPEHAFTNGAAVATGVFGRVGDRNVPTLLNRNGTHGQFWDMRAGSLEAQALAVIANPLEMGGDLDGLVRRVEADPEYQRLFHDVFGRAPDLPGVSQALAAFERTLASGEAPYDRYIAGDLTALTAAQIRGRALFFEKFKCVSCHSGPNFSDEKLNVRCYPATTNLVAVPVLRFKTPTLRNLVYTAPYMHNGALKTLDEVVEFYNPSMHLNAEGKPEPGSPAVHITSAEKKDLVAFLKSLSAPRAYVEIH
jgi:cytochrome c peroxidase